MRYGLAALLMCAAPIAPAVAQTAPVQDAAEQARATTIVDGITKMKAGDAAGAIAVLDPVLAEYEKLYPNADSRIYCTTDGALIVSGKTAISENWCFGMWAKGFALVDLGKLDEALPYVARASAMMPERAQFAAELGYIHQAQKHWQLSIDSYREAERRALKMADEKDRNFELRRAWFGIGYDQIELGQLDAAEASLKKALQVAPDDQKIKDELEYIRQQRAAKKS